AGRLAEHVGALAGVRRPHGQRLQRIAGLEARPAARGVALQRGDRTVRRPADCHFAIFFEAMRGLFSFPNPVNETSARLVAGSVAVLAVLTVAFQQGWLLPVLAYGFVARTLTGPTLSPLALVATRLVTPRLPVAHRYAPGP